ncbi:PREDICTED: carbohydrate sulfotransferase 1-like [Branchiostoma belcheri]|uniref:Sulfotransferase n=1 Tax=Branchiostoma belcheri TaxID=7741 RepID=A0A6P4YAV6_BRABE|nr:PREDICTED: carbohydrate sulfotransferase 1-like [Branchiostoma belcheri]
MHVCRRILLLNLRKILLFVLFVGTSTYTYLAATFPYEEPTDSKILSRMLQDVRSPRDKREVISEKLQDQKSVSKLIIKDVEVEQSDEVDPLEYIFGGFQDSSVTTSARPRTSKKPPPKAEAPPAAEKRTAVIVMTQMRSGSTFVGEIFNQHPEAFYFFEPVWALEYNKNKAYNSSKWQLKLLEGLSKCRFEPIRDIMQFYLTTKELGVMKTCKAIDKMCDGYRNKTAMWPGRCPIPNDQFTEILEMNCIKNTFTAIKTIRLNDITLFKPLTEDPELDFKIIQLVRDPRAIIASRLALVKNNVSVTNQLHDDVDRTEVRAVCNWMTTNMQPYREKREWLRKRYALVRYEDVGLDPITTMARFYRLINIPMSRDVSKWLGSHTKTSKKLKDRKDPFGTKKDSEKTANEWRTRLSFQQVEIIQSECKEAMTLFNYKFVESNEELKDISVSLYKKRPPLLF